MKPDPISATFSALADPMRRDILARLATGPTTVGELAEPFEVTAPAISRHLKVLETAGLIERKVEAQWRLCSINPEGLKPAADWIESYRRFWENRFDALDEYLQTTTSTGAENDISNGDIDP